MSLADARTLDNNTVLEADLCIIGGGAAGIAIAAEFLNTQHKILLLESGGLEPDDITQALYDGKVSGLEYDLTNSRSRYFGGSSNCWQGWCAPLAPEDFEKRDWVPHSGWPITHTDLAPYYARAAHVLDLASDNFDVASVYSKEEAASVDGFENHMWRVSRPTRHGEKYREALQRADNIRILLHANVTRIATNNNRKQVDKLEVRTLSGRRHTVRARNFVLACGGIENARLLLASNGLGNAHGVVGRFFMEHPHLYDFASIVHNGNRPPGFGIAVHKDHCVSNLVLARKVCKEQGLITASLEIYANPSPIEASTQAMLDHMAEINFIQGPFAAVDNVHIRMEQSPNPDSRVLLTDKKDVLGMPVASLDWRIRPEDFACLKTICKLLVQNYGTRSYGIMRINSAAFLATDVPDDVKGGNHHMGTTRMSDDPQFGVVDKNCKLHGTENLFLAGSSVFTTSGWANPTYTLTALALRLADHLKSGLG